MFETIIFPPTTGFLFPHVVTIAPLALTIGIIGWISQILFAHCATISSLPSAEGRLEMVAQCANKIWDIHPIMPIVRASGAIVTTWGNKNPVVGGNIIVSNNKANHKQILKLLKPLAE